MLLFTYLFKRRRWRRPGRGRRAGGRGARAVSCTRGVGLRGVGSATLPQLDPPDPEDDQPLPHCTLDPSPSFLGLSSARQLPPDLTPPASFRSSRLQRGQAQGSPPSPQPGGDPNPTPPAAPPPCIMHLRPRPRPNTEVAAGRRGRAAEPSRCNHLPFPRHSAHPAGSATEQPPRSSAAPKPKGVRLRHHNQMAEPPWPAAQPAHWTLPPPNAATIGCCPETLSSDWLKLLPLIREAADPASMVIRLVCAAGAGGSRTERSWLSLQSPKTRRRGFGVY